MKKVIALSLIVFACACNSGETSTEESSDKADSMVNTNTEENQNESPMRNRDTSTNLMQDTMQQNGDSAGRP